MPEWDGPGSLSGRRILVVEDEFVIATELQEELEGRGAEVVGPASSLDDAFGLIGGDAAIDGAVLDVNLKGHVVYPIADALRDRGVPFVFTTGYDERSLPERYAGVIRLEKPIDIERVSQALIR